MSVACVIIKLVKKGQLMSDYSLFRYYVPAIQTWVVGAIHFRDVRQFLIEHPEATRA